jgi:hypothetical protein
LEGNWIGDQGCSYLSSVLPFTRISHLGLRDNRIGVHGCAHLAEMLSRALITSLNLADNWIGDEGCNVLAAALPGTNLESLSLAGHHVFGVNGISDEGFVALGSLAVHETYVLTSWVLFFVCRKCQGICCITS